MVQWIITIIIAGLAFGYAIKLFNRWLRKTRASSSKTETKECNSCSSDCADCPLASEYFTRLKKEDKPTPK